MSETVTMRPELVGKGFRLIEFLFARLAEDPDASDADRATLERYQGAEVDLLNKFSREQMAEAADAAEAARGIAARYADHPDYQAHWLP